MSNTLSPNKHILIAGNQALIAGLTTCLLKAGHVVTVYNTADALDITALINQHITDTATYTGATVTTAKLAITNQLTSHSNINLVIAVTQEDLAVKTALLNQIESSIAVDVPIAINTDTLLLSQLQQSLSNPERLLGANWTEPVHTTCFLEIISNATVKKQLVSDFYQIAKEHWDKDPYVVSTDGGIRTRLLCALLREAFYLVENNYVTVEDIDRACRNDAGYYMPFAGNFRYMDLMGTYMYGVVMQDLNPELSKNKHIPAFCKDVLMAGGEGMANGKGFYDYAPGEAAEWQSVFRKFSYQIQEIIHKYPFNYTQANVLTEK